VSSRRPWWRRVFDFFFLSFQNPEIRTLRATRQVGRLVPVDYHAVIHGIMDFSCGCVFQLFSAAKLALIVDTFMVHLN
jgi:hypothetical protein